MKCSGSAAGGRSVREQSRAAREPSTALLLRQHGRPAWLCTEQSAAARHVSCDREEGAIKHIQTATSPNFPRHSACAAAGTPRAERGGTCHPAWFEHPRLPTPSHPTVPTNTPPHPARIACSTRPLLHLPRPRHRSATSRTDGVPNSRRCHGQVSSQLPADPPLRLPTDPCLQRYGILEAWYGRQCSHPA
jgi:hypothetical protein